MSLRDQLAEQIGNGLHRPVRWALPRHAVGDYDGRERTLEIFLTDPSERRLLLQALRPWRQELDRTAGGPVVFVFHSRAETRRLYPDVLPAGALSGMRVHSAGSYGIRIEPVPVDVLTPVRLTHGSLEIVLAGATE